MAADNEKFHHLATRDRIARYWGEPAEGTRSMVSLVAIQPIVALLVGILILILPRLLNYLIAIYLIFIGLTGLFPHLLTNALH
jgi:hypothetical protein